MNNSQPESLDNRDQPKTATDPRRAAWKPFRDMCNRLAGDSVLVPALMRRDRLTRYDLTPVAHWSDIAEDDIPRLAILTDSFARFIGHGDDASVVTVWREGTPIVVQVGGEPNEEAVDLVTDVICGNIARIDRAERESATQEAANDNEPISKFKRGDRVVHGKLGAGTVLLSVGGRSTVKFDSGEQSYFIDAFLKPTDVPAPTPIRATPFVLRDPSSLPERDWLYGKHYIRQYATASVGPGGGGKTAHSISETLAMVTGRPLLDPDAGLASPLRVWWINCEDPQPEIDRRFHAAAKHFNVTAEQIGDRLFTDSGRDQDFVIARQVGRDLKIVDPFIDQMVAEIDRRRIDVVIVDPFVSTHEAQENDNTAMQRVAAAWTVVADRANCGVELVHHVAKGQGEITADSARGGGAFKDKVRSMRVFNVMTAAEAEKAGVDDPRSYFRVDLGKVNMVASGRSQWRRFVSVPLGNGKGLVKTGDEIGVVEPWRWPSQDVLAERAAEQRRAVVADVPDDLLAGLKVRLGASDHKYDPKGKPWAGDLVMELTGVTDRKEARAMLDAWIEGGDLDVVELYDASTRKPRNFVKPANAPT